MVDYTPFVWSTAPISPLLGKPEKIFAVIVFGVISEKRLNGNLSATVPPPSCSSALPVPVAAATDRSIAN